MARSKRGLLSAILVILMLAMMIPTASAASVNAYINRSTQVYISPSTSSMSVTVPANMQVNFTAMNGGWAQVKNGSVTGYVPLQYICLLYTSRGKSRRARRLGRAPAPAHPGDHERIEQAQRSAQIEERPQHGQLALAVRQRGQHCLLYTSPQEAGIRGRACAQSPPARRTDSPPRCPRRCPASPVRTPSRCV